MITPEETKHHTEQFLGKHGIKVPSHLPVLDEQHHLMPPTSDAVARRLLILGYLIGASYNASPKEIAALLKSHKLWHALSLSEKNLLAKKTFTNQDKINASWLSECAEVLAWALGQTDLDHFHRAKEAYAKKIPIKADPTEFIADSLMRPFDEIYKQADLIFRLHWFAIQAHYDQKPCEIDWEVMQERHRAANWIIGEEPDWDEITTDT